MTEPRKIIITFRRDTTPNVIGDFVQESMVRGFQINQRPDFNETPVSVTITLPASEIDIIQSLPIIDRVRKMR